MAIATGAILVLLIVGLDMLKNQGRLIQTIMANLQDFKDLLTRVDVATNNIAADLVRLADQIAAGGLSSADEAEISAALKLAAEKLEAVAAVNPEPEPEPTPEEPE
jgi:type II secretory pathway component PulM